MSFGWGRVGMMGWWKRISCWWYFFFLCCLGIGIISLCLWLFFWWWWWWKLFLIISGWSRMFCWSLFCSLYFSLRYFCRCFWWVWKRIRRWWRRWGRGWIRWGRGWMLLWGGWWCCRGWWRGRGGGGGWGCMWLCMGWWWCWFWWFLLCLSWGFNFCGIDMRGCIYDICLVFLVSIFYMVFWWVIFDCVFCFW